MKKIVLCAALLLSACGGRAAPELYTLHAQAPELAACRNPSSLLVDEPVIGPGLDSARVVVMAAGDKQTFYRGVRWNAPVSAMLQHYFADGFEQSGLFSPVIAEDSSTRTKWQLETQVRAFEVDQSKASPRVVIRLSATLIDTATRRAVITVPLKAEADVAGKHMDEIVAEFNRQMDGLTLQLLQKLRPKLAGC